MIKDDINSRYNISKMLRAKGMSGKLIELENRGLELTPIQANLLLLGGRGYGKTYLSMVMGAEWILENCNKGIDYDIRIDSIGKRDPDFGVYNEKDRDKQYAFKFIAFLKEYYPEIKVLKYIQGTITLKA